MDAKLKTVRGLSIANIILLSVVILIVVGVGLLCNVLLDAFLGQADARAQLSQSFASNPEFATLPVDQLSATLTGIIWAFIGGYVLFSVIMIIGSAITLSRIKNNPNKIGGCIGWAIAGIVLSFFSGLVISLILYIIATAFIASAKSAIDKGEGIPQKTVTSTEAPLEPARISASNQVAQSAETAKTTADTSAVMNAATVTKTESAKPATSDTTAATDATEAPEAAKHAQKDDTAKKTVNEKTKASAAADDDADTATSADQAKTES